MPTVAVSALRAAGAIFWSFFVFSASALEPFLVKDINTAPTAANAVDTPIPSHIVYFNGYFYFNDVVERPYSPFIQGGLFRFEGSGKPWEKVYPHNGESFPITDMIVLNGRLLLSAGGLLYVSDGSTTGTHQIDGASVGSKFEIGGNSAFFVSAAEPVIWQTDGTAENTLSIKRIDSSKAISNLKFVNDKLFFISRSIAERNELWISDRTMAGTHLIKDLGQSIDIHRELVACKDLLVFTNLEDDSPYEYSLNVSDGTPEGTQNIKSDFVGTDLTVSGNQVFFITMRDQIRELWRTDGTAAGTALVKASEVEPSGAFHFRPYGLIDIDGTLFIFVYDSATELVITQIIITIHHYITHKSSLY